MPSTDDFINAVNTATDKSKTNKFFGISVCEKLDFVYDTLEELKQKSPWHWKVVIRQVHGLISAARRKLKCNKTDESSKPKYPRGW